MSIKSDNTSPPTSGQSSLDADANLMRLWREYAAARAAYVSHADDGTPANMATADHLEGAYHVAADAFGREPAQTPIGVMHKLAFIRRESAHDQDFGGVTGLCTSSVAALRTAADAADSMVTAGLSLPFHTTTIPSIGMTFRQAADRVRELLDWSEASADRDPDDNGPEKAQRRAARKEWGRLNNAIADTPAATIGDVVVKLERLACPYLGAKHFEVDAEDLDAIARDLKIIACWTAPTATKLPDIAAGPDADMLAAAQALDRMLESHDALYERLRAAGLDPWEQPAFTASLRAMRAAGSRYARTPAVTIRGLLLKLRRLSDEVDVGETVWRDDLMMGIVADAERFEAMMGVADDSLSAARGNADNSTGAPADDAEMLAAFRPWVDERRRLDAVEALHQPVDYAEYNRLSEALLTTPARSFFGVVGKLAAALDLGAADDPDGVERRAIGDAQREALTIADPIQREVADLLAEGVAVLVNAASSTADSFADAVAAFEAEAPAVLALPQAPTDTMTHAAARAAGITPEQFTSAYTAAVQAFQQERAA